MPRRYPFLRINPPGRIRILHPTNHFNTGSDCNFVQFLHISDHKICFTYLTWTILLYILTITVQYLKNILFAYDKIQIPVTFQFFESSKNVQWNWTFRREYAMR